MSKPTSYTAEEVAEILQISRFTVYELIKRGELTAYRIGRKLRIDPADLEYYKSKAKGASSSTITETEETTASPSLSPEDIVIICGQDNILDVLTRHLGKKIPYVSFLRHYIGSIDGLLALYRNKVSIATAHLWDGDTGEYNLPYIRHLLPGQKVYVFNLVYRNIGFYVAKGNPKNILTWTDLAKPDIRLVNRELGSGARVLLDEQLRQLDINHNYIAGYNREETSHLAVASCVARGEGDVGLGTEQGSLQVKEIDFIPLMKERYDLIVKKSNYNKPYFQALLSLLKSNELRNEIAEMSGYDVSHMGELLLET